MKLNKIIAFILCAGTASSAFASWQMAVPKKVDDQGPFFQAGKKHFVNPAWKENKSFAKTFGAISATYLPYSMHVSENIGTLKDNLEHIMKSQPYQLIWKDKNDYRVVGNITIKAKNFMGALSKLLKNYPVKAVFYSTNNIVTIVPRKI